MLKINVLRTLPVIMIIHVQFAQGVIILSIIDVRNAHWSRAVVSVIQVDVVNALQDII